MKHLLRIADLTPQELHALIEKSAEIKTHPFANDALLKDQVVVEYYNKPSTRTRLSFASAITRLGGHPEVVGATDLQLGRGETIEDTARVISRYAAAFVIRTFADSDVQRYAEASNIPVINALTDLHHPCQAIADALTITEKVGQLKGTKVLYVGDGNNVAHSLIEMAALSGIELTVATPQGREPDIAISKAAAELAPDNGGSITVTNELEPFLDSAQVIYTDVWASMGVSDEEAAKSKTKFGPYQINAEIMEKTNAIFMHCLPAHRGEEVTDDVVDSERSVVFDQAENRMHTAQAILSTLVAGN